MRKDKKNKKQKTPEILFSQTHRQLMHLAYYKSVKYSLKAEIV